MILKLNEERKELRIVRQWLKIFLMEVVLLVVLEMQDGTKKTEKMIPIIMKWCQLWTDELFRLNRSKNLNL